MLAFELLVPLQVFFSEIDGELQMLSTQAPVRTDASHPDPDQTFPGGGVDELEGGFRTVRIKYGSADKRLAPAR